MRRLGDPLFNKLGIKTVPWGLGRSGGGYFRKVLSTEPNNLIGYWIMDEASSAVSIDSSPEGNDGAYTNVTLGQPGIGDGRTSALFDGATSFNNVYSAALNGDFNGAEGTLLIWLQVDDVGVWTDGTLRLLGQFRVDGNNRVYLAKNAVNNELRWLYISGAVNRSADIGGFADTDFFSMGLTWSETNDEIRRYKDGAPQGVVSTLLGAWAGNLSATDTAIGAAGTGPAAVTDGLLAHAVLWNAPLTPAQMANVGAL